MRQAKTCCRSGPRIWVQLSNFCKSVNVISLAFEELYIHRGVSLLHRPQEPIVRQ